MIRGWIVPYDENESTKVYDLYRRSPLKRSLTEKEYAKIENLFWQCYDPVYWRTKERRARTGDPIFLPVPD